MASAHDRIDLSEDVEQTVDHCTDPEDQLEDFTEADTKDDGINKSDLQQENFERRKPGRPRKKPPDPVPKEKRKVGRPRDESKHNVPCDVCGKIFKEIYQLKLHYTLHTGVKAFECDICHKRYRTKGEVKSHMKTHTGVRPYKCPHCSECFAAKLTLKKHLFKHTQQGVKCPECPLVLATSHCIKQHMKQVHLNERHVCQICGKTYFYLKYMISHIEGHNQRICSFCGKEFDTMPALKTHLHTHAPIKCSLCNRPFKTEEELQAHGKLRGRAYQCELCCYSFNKAEFLENHHRRNHWKEMGLERLRWNFPPPKPRPRKPKPPKKAKVPVKIIDIKVTDTTQSGAAQFDESVPVSVEAKSVLLETPLIEKVKESHMVETLSNQSLNAEDVPSENDPNETEHQSQDFDRDDSPINDGSDDSDQEDSECTLNSPTKESDHTGHFKVDVEPQAFPEKIFVKVEEIDDIDQESQNSLIKVEPEDAKKIKEESSDSEDDNVPLSVIRLKSVQEPSHGNEKIASNNDSSDSAEKTNAGRRIGRSRLFSKKAQLKKQPKQPSEIDQNMCKFCYEQFMDKESLADHLKTHTGEKLFKCRWCNRSFRFNRNLKVHIKTHENIPCKKCEVVCKGRTEYNEHKKTVHPIKRVNASPVMCELCGKYYASAASLIVHRTLHPEFQRFQCDQCPRGFSMKRMLETHKRIDHQGERYVCATCGKQFKHRPDLKIHLTLHSGEKPYKCDQCPAAYRHASVLATHKLKHQNVVFPCKICGKKLKTPNSIRMHMLLHNGEKRLSCEVCGHKFYKRQTLLKHMEIHTLDRQLECIVCKYICYKKIDLTIHHATEHPNHPLIGKTAKIHPCNQCEMKFTKRSLLLQHMEIHDTEGKYKCDVCEDKRFKQMASLKHHWLHFHGMKLPKQSMSKKSEQKMDDAGANSVAATESHFTGECDFMIQSNNCESTVSD